MQHFIFLYYLIAFLGGVSAITLLIILHVKYGQRWIIHYIFLLVTVLGSVLLSGIQYYAFSIVHLEISSPVFVLMNISYFIIFGGFIYLLPMMAHFLTQTPVTVVKRVIYGGLGMIPVPLIGYCLLAIPDNEAKSKFVNFWNYGPYSALLITMFAYALVYTILRIRHNPNAELKKIFRTIVVVCISFLPAIVIDTQWELFQIQWKILPRAFTFLPLLFFIVSLLTIIYTARYFFILGGYERDVKDHRDEIRVTEAFSTQYGISSREKEIIRRIIEGDSNVEIAGKLSLALGTVKNYVYSVYKKTGIDSRIELLNLLRRTH
jgi:DNA-binding CsgD family transcriptional regulator